MKFFLGGSIIRCDIASSDDRTVMCGDRSIYHSGLSWATSTWLSDISFYNTGSRLQFVNKKIYGLGGNTICDLSCSFNLKLQEISICVTLIDWTILMMWAMWGFAILTLLPVASYAYTCHGKSVRSVRTFWCLPFLSYKLGQDGRIDRQSAVRNAVYTGPHNKPNMKAAASLPMQCSSYTCLVVRSPQPSIRA